MRKAPASKGSKKKATKPVKAKARVKAKAKPAVPKPAAVSGVDLRHQFVAIAMRLGPDEAQRLLDAVVEVQTPMLPVKR